MGGGVLAPHPINKNQSTMNKKQFDAYVLSMSREMGDLTIEQFATIEAKMRAVAYVNKKHQVRCMDCNHTWVADKCDIDGTIECPVCHRKLKIEWTEKTCMDEMEYASISQAWGDHWQVVRYFACYHYSRLTNFPVKQVFEVMQVWISDTGNVSYIARDLSMYPNRQRNPFILSRPMGVKHPEKSHGYYYGYDIRSIRCDSLKVFSVAKFLRYYGITKSVNRQNAGFYLDVLFSYIQEPLVEVLYKSKQYGLMWSLLNKGFYNKDEHYAERIASLKIALRHDYFKKIGFVEKRNQKHNDNRPLYSDWIDHIQNVFRLGLDNRSPHYICPEDFRQMHDQIMRRVMNIGRAERESEKTKRLLSDEEKKKFYIEQRKPFFDMELKSDEFTIKVLPSVEAFEKEGTEMHHCVFANEYYDVDRNPNTLILSARKGDDWNNPDEIIETIEVSLREYSIIQSRGHCNGNTPYHNKIMALVLNHMDEIKAINEARLAKKQEAA